MKDVNRLIDELKGCTGNVGAAGDWKLTGDLFDSLADVAPSLTDEQRQRATEQALRIYLAQGVGTYSGGAGRTLLMAIGTGATVVSIWEGMSRSGLEGQYVKFGLEAMTRILEREVTNLSDSILITLSTLEPISTYITRFGKQWEPDEHTESWDVSTIIDCREIRDMARLELQRRTQQE